MAWRRHVDLPIKVVLRSTYVVTHVERRIQADANALTTMANPLTRRAWNCLAPFTEIYVHISLHDIIKNRVGSSTSKRSAAEYKTNSL